MHQLEAFCAAAVRARVRVHHHVVVVILVVEVVLIVIVIVIVVHHRWQFFILTVHLYVGHVDKNKIHKQGL